MKVSNYILSILLVIWGLLIGWTKLFSVGLHFPFLTVATVFAIIAGVSKYKKADLILFTSACLWLISSAVTFGFVIFFDEGDYGRMFFGIIPFVLGTGLLISVQTKLKLSNTLLKKILLVPLLMFIGIGSYIYKPTTKEINCWYYFENGKSYNVLFAVAPEHTFEVQLSSEGLKEEVKADALQYEGRDGYYCPETKVKVVTSFGQVISAEVVSFRNSEIDKKVTFNNPTKIPLDKTKGKLEILKPYILSIWN